jgi:hypothetical protein
MASAVLEIPSRDYSRLLKHLLPSRPRSEEAAFLFCRAVDAGTEVVFRFVESYAVPVVDFQYKSISGMVLNDGCRAKVIKRAHDLGAALLEVHSHPTCSVAEFSPSDFRGFAEFVPHVRWRLKQRPYGAIVVGPDSLDSLFWATGSVRPDGVLNLNTGRRRLAPTGRSFELWEGCHDR